MSSPSAQTQHKSAPARLRETVGSARGQTGVDPSLVTTTTAAAAASSSSSNQLGESGNAALMASGDLSHPPTPPSPGLGDSLSPTFDDANSPKMLASKHEQNLKRIMEFVGKITTQSATNGGKMSLESLLERAGFVKDTGESSGDDDDADMRSASSSGNFSFHLGSELGSSIFSSGALSKNLVGSTIARFSSELAHRSYLENNPQLMTREQREARDKGWKPKKSEALAMQQVMVPWRGQAAIMTVDLSGYSAVASALNDKGVDGAAFALNAAVNQYFETILQIVQSNGGDLVTFAGDSAVITWCCTDLRTPVEVCVQACSCAAELQRRAGSSHVEGIEGASFGIHIAVTFGQIESLILKAAQSENSQESFHFVSGAPLLQNAELLGLAARGETCVSESVHSNARTFLRVKPVLEAKEGAFLLTGIDDDSREVLDNMQVDLRVQRSPWLERTLVPPVITAKLQQGFNTKTIAEMRPLCILFIKKDQKIAAVDTTSWFGEVQGLLDASRASVVQVLDDDKGVHIIAAVGMYTTEVNAAGVGVELARRLVDRNCGCVIGVAFGPTFVGVVGAADVACRWDLTSPATVRAARLMQAAESKGVTCLFDASVAANTEDDSQLERHSEMKLKGSPVATPTYVLAPHAVSVTAGIISVLWGSVTFMAEQREVIQSHLTQKYQTSLLFISGAVGAGKKTAVVFVLRGLGLNSIWHLSTREKAPLNLLKTLADWWSHHMDEELSEGGRQLREHIERGKITQALNTAHGLVTRFIQLGHSLVVGVAHCHLLDKSSMNFIKSVVQRKPVCSTDCKGGKEGRLMFVLTSYPLWGFPSPKELRQEFTLALRENERTIKLLSDAEREPLKPKIQTELVHVHVGYTKSTAEFADAFRGVTYWVLRDSCAKILHEATGGCLSLIQPVVDLLRSRFLSLLSRGTSIDVMENARTFYMPATLDGTLHMTSAGEDFFFREIEWKTVAPAATSRLTELYDAAPPRLQLIMRVIASLGTTTGAANRYHVVKCMQKLNKKLSEERLHSDISTLIDSEILKVSSEEEDEVLFAVPAMVDCVMAMLTPEQDRMLKRYAYKLADENAYSPQYALHSSGKASESFIEPAWFAVFTSFIARLARAAGENDQYQMLMKRSWQQLINNKDSARGEEVRKKLEERFYIEHRQHPNLLKPELFEGMAEKPVLARHLTPAESDLLSAEAGGLMPSEVVWITQFYPPFALGALSGELQKICWLIGNNLVDLTKPKDLEFINPQMRAMLQVDMDKLFEAWAKLLKMFETGGGTEQLCARPLASQMKFAPKKGTCTDFDSFEVPKNLEDERKLMEELLVYPKSVEEGLRNLRVFRAYFIKTVMPRRDAAVAMQMMITKPEDIQCSNMISRQHSSDPVRHAYDRLCRPYPIPSAAVHNAIMDLSTAGWSSMYYHVNLQVIRDQVLRNHTATTDDFKSFLALNVGLGEVLTPLPDNMAVVAGVGGKSTMK